MRRTLYEAASGLLTRVKDRYKVKTWGQQVAKRSCHRKAVVAVARKLALIMARWHIYVAIQPPTRTTPRNMRKPRTADSWVRHDEQTDDS